jgi:signal transduction histidine kinase
VRVGATTVTIASTAPLHALAGPLREAMTPLIVTLVLLAAGLLAGVVLQVRLGLRPLTLLRAELTKVRTGRTERIVGPQPSEVRPLVAELNTLLDQNAVNLERARRHVANLAHGLKTPLATLALALEEPGRDRDGRLRPLVTGMDRRIRHHLTRARAAALGGADRKRALLAPRIADHVAALRNSMRTKAWNSRSKSTRAPRSPAKARTSTKCSAT